MLRVTLFFRAKYSENYSIEQLFESITPYLNEEVKTTKVYSPYVSSGFINRIKLGLFLRKKQDEINHITGDIHFLAFFLKKRNTILTIHDCYPPAGLKGLKLRLYFWLWFKLPAKRVAKITVISETTKQALQELTKLPDHKIHYIPDSYHPAFTPLEKEFDHTKPVILQVGTRPNKNIPNLLEAVRGLSCKIILIGEVREEFKHYLKDETYDIELYKNLAISELHQLYGRADIVSFVSDYEGFGLPIIEANAVGRPVVTSNVEPMKSVAGEAAMTVEPNNPKELRRAFCKLMEDDSERERLILNGYLNAKKFHPATIAREYITVYKEVANK